MTVQRSVLALLLVMLVVPSVLLSAHELDPSYLSVLGLYSSDFLTAYWRAMAVAALALANTAAAIHAALSRDLSGRVRVAWVLAVVVLPLVAAMAYCMWRLLRQSSRVYPQPSRGAGLTRR